MAVVLVEGITDRIALEAVAGRLGLDLGGIEIVPIGGAQAVRRAAAEREGERVVGLCDAPEERWFRRVLGDATYVCVQNLEDELIRALGAGRVEEIVAAEGDLDTFRNFQNQPAWRGRSTESQLLRWMHNGDRHHRYPPLLIAALEPDEIPLPLADVLTDACRGRRVGRDEPLASCVREAGVGELTQVCATLADAFATDPVYGWLFPGLRRREASLRRLFAVEVEHYVLPAGRVLTTDDFSGASLEVSPGRWKLAVPVSGALGFVRACGLRLPRASRLQGFFERHHLQEPHYYIRAVGVATRFQGQGLGTALLRPTLDRCDREGLPAYLEASTERSAALYERLGFVHLGELRVPDGPAFWPMRRPPG